MKMKKHPNMHRPFRIFVNLKEFKRQCHSLVNTGCRLKKAIVN